VDWYTRLEQGRDSLPSRQTVDALAKALRLSPEDHAHLADLAMGSAARTFRKEEAPPHLVKLVGDLGTPAYVINIRYDPLCWNGAAAKMFRDFSKIPTSERNASPDVLRA
jgi:hypothetical protein